MTTVDLSLEDLKRYVGQRQISTDVATAGPANLLRLTFGRAEPALRNGDPLPPGWHGLYFLPRLGPGELRPDGTAVGRGRGPVEHLAPAHVRGRAAPIPS